MKRREFIMLLGGAAAAWPLAARAQQPPGGRRRLGVLMLYPENVSEGQLRAKAIRQGLGSTAVMFRSIFNWALETPIGYDPPPRSCCDWRRT